MGEGKDSPVDRKPNDAVLEVGPMYKMIAQNTSDAAVQLDTDWRIRFANFATARMFGRDATTLEGRLLDELLHPSCRKVVEETLQSMVGRYRLNQASAVSSSCATPAAAAQACSRSLFA